MKNDQYFEVGDKVMRVCWGTELQDGTFELDTSSDEPDFGEVMCVESFKEASNGNEVVFVGSGGWREDECGDEYGWLAACFRRVEKIKLCVNAASQVKQPSEPLPA